jgi:DNA modification methylase
MEDNNTRIFHDRKPVEWFVKGKRKDTDFLSDVVFSEKPDKVLDPWEQSPVEATRVIARLSLPNDIVSDPMIGSGTTGIATQAEP